MNKLLSLAESLMGCFSFEKKGCNPLRCTIFRWPQRYKFLIGMLQAGKNDAVSRLLDAFR